MTALKKNQLWYISIPDFKQASFLLSGAVFFTLWIASVLWALLVAPSDIHQGEVYRILYLHVPAAFTAFLSSFFLGFLSFYQLWKGEIRAQITSQAIAELGLLFTSLTLMTGMIWGKPTWGVWWTWDARLTTTLILALLYSGYLLLNLSLATLQLRSRLCSFLGILIMLEVPIIYKSVSWWRTLHQPPSILASGGTQMSPAILYSLLIICFTTILCAFWFVWFRVRNLQMRENLNQILLEQFSKNK